MVHTLPDYTTKYRMVKIFGQIDSGELAARLGSSSLIDRRGNFVWHDDFEGSTLNWSIADISAGAAVSLSTNKSYLGSQSCKLSTGDTINNAARIRKGFWQPSDTDVGIEMMVNLADVNANLSLNAYGYNGTNLYNAILEWRQANNTLYIFVETAGWTAIASDVITNYDYERWTMFKLVYNWDTKYYTRAIVGDVEYDISSKEIGYTGDETDPYLYISIDYQTLSAADRIAYIDNVIFTQNEEI